MRRDFGSISYNNMPAKGYDAEQPYYVSEQGNIPVPASFESLNRRQRRMAARALKYAGTMEVISPDGEVHRPLGNKNLVIHDHKESIVDAVRDNQVVIIVAETGVGKSTQVPQWLVEAGYNVVMTQPRRMAARNLAERTGSEIAEVWDDVDEDIAGYHTAESSSITENTRIAVVTDGLRVAQDLNDRGEVINEVLIIDEVHEWNKNIEVLIGIVKKQLADNPNMRVVIMSATMDAEGLSNYFAEAIASKPPIIDVPNRTFEIEQITDPVVNPEQTLNSTVAEQTVRYAVEGKNVLVFMPGKREISNLMDELERMLPSDVLESAMILPLHSKMSDQDQQRVYHQYPGTKIIIATNVAQTSLTIPDIDVVIDSGYERRTEIDKDGVSSLVLNPISRADCVQRAGRAGRVKNGIYVLTKLDQDTPFIALEDRDAYPIPEILRTDIDRNILQFAAAGIDFATLDIFHPVDPAVIERSKKALHILGALDENGEVTELGLKMNDYPLMPSLARMIVEAEQYSPQIRSHVAAIAAVAEAGGLPYYAPKSERRWATLTDESESDLLAQLDMFIKIQNSSVGELVEYDLDVKNVERAREQYRKIIMKSDAKQGDLVPPNLQERENIKRCIYAGNIDFVYEYAGNREFERVGVENEVSRELSNRSFVKGQPRMVVARPYLVRTPKNGEWIDRHILESVSVIEDPAILGQVALNLCSWSPATQIRWRKGRPILEKRQLFKGSDIGITQEFEAEPSPELRQIIINYTLEHPGPAQRQLREIKSELERLNHLSKHPIPQFTQDMLLAWINEAATSDITDPGIVDRNLRNRMFAEQFTLDSFVSKENKSNIEQNSPGEISVEGYVFRVNYQNGKPYVKNADAKIISSLPGEVFLADGRQVWFVGEHGKYRDVQHYKELVLS